MIQTPEGDTIEGTDGDWARLQSRSWETDFRQPSFEDQKCLLYTGHSQIAEGGHNPLQTTVLAAASNYIASLGFGSTGLAFLDRPIRHWREHEHGHRMRTDH